MHNDDQRRAGDPHQLEQLGTRLPRWMMSKLRRASRDYDIPIRQVVEDFIAAGLELKAKQRIPETWRRDPEAHERAVTIIVDHANGREIIVDGDRDIVIRDARQTPEAADDLAAFDSVAELFNDVPATGEAPAEMPTVSHPP